MPKEFPKRVRGECAECRREVSPRELDLTPCGLPVHENCFRRHVLRCAKPPCVEHWYGPDMQDGPVLVAAETPTGEESKVDGTILASLKSKCVGKAILDSGASDDIVGVETLQDHGELMDTLGFAAESEISMGRGRTKNFLYGNDASSQSLGEATLTTGQLGCEVSQRFQVVEGGAPFLLSAPWLQSMKATIDFEHAVGQFRALSNSHFQLERAPSGHLLFPLLSFAGNRQDLEKMRVDNNPSIDELTESKQSNTCAPE